MGSCLQKSRLYCSSIENTKDFSILNYKGYCKVLDVYDGDTITISFPFYGGIYKKKLRIYGVDCAEVKTKDLSEKKVGLSGKEYLSDLILRKILYIEICKKDDKYGRLLAKVFLGDTTIDKIMIEKNFGYPYFGGKKKKFSEWYNKR